MEVAFLRELQTIYERQQYVFIALHPIYGACMGDPLIRATLRAKRPKTPKMSSLLKVPMRCKPILNKHRARNNGWYVVGKTLLLILLNCSPWPCLGPTYLLSNVLQTFISGSAVDRCKLSICFMFISGWAYENTPILNRVSVLPSSVLLRPPTGHFRKVRTVYPRACLRGQAAFV